MLSFFPRGVLDEILNFIESVSGFSFLLFSKLINGQFNFTSVFHWVPSIVKLRMTLVSCVKPTESYKVCRLGRQLCSTLTGTDRNGSAELPHWARLCRPCIAAIAGCGYKLWKKNRCGIDLSGEFLVGHTFDFDSFKHQLK